MRGTRASARSRRDLEHPAALFFTHSGLQGNDKMMTNLLRIVSPKSTSRQRFFPEIPASMPQFMSHLCNNFIAGATDRRGLQSTTFSPACPYRTLGPRGSRLGRTLACGSLALTHPWPGGVLGARGGGAARIIRRSGFDALGGSGYLTRPAPWGRWRCFPALPALTSTLAGDRGNSVELLRPDRLQLLCARSSAG
jgi:hypothetical protein